MLASPPTPSALKVGVYQISRLVSCCWALRPRVNERATPVASREVRIIGRRVDNKVGQDSQGAAAVGKALRHDQRSVPPLLPPVFAGMYLSIGVGMKYRKGVSR